MDNQQVIDIFMGRGLVDQYLAEDMIAAMETSGKSIAETLTDFEITSQKDDIWPVIASELGADPCRNGSFTWGFASEYWPRRVVCRSLRSIESTDNGGFTLCSW